jgi:hypothetical protein
MWRGAISSAGGRRLPLGMKVLLAALLAAQIAWRSHEALVSTRPAPLPAPPPPAWIAAASLGEPVPMAGLLALWLQTAGDAPGASLPFADLDYARLEAWLFTLLALDPQADSPLLLASHVYAQVPDPMKQRRMLDFTYRAFFADPDRRWRFLAHAALVAKHRLHDLPLALHYARAVAEEARGDAVPHWARQMPIFILEEMGELEAARIELGAWLESGAVRDPRERRFLTERLLEMERRAGAVEKPSAVSSP